MLTSITPKPDLNISCTTYYIKLSKKSTNKNVSENKYNKRKRKRKKLNSIKENHQQAFLPTVVLYDHSSVVHIGDLNSNNTESELVEITEV
jgi:hypothetical protein